MIPTVIINNTHYFVSVSNIYVLLIKNTAIWNIFSDNGVINEQELFNALQVAVKNNGIDFDEKELQKLTKAFWNDTTSSEPRVMNLDELQNKLSKYPGLSEGLSSR